MVKTLPANAGDMGSIPRVGQSPGERNGNPLQYSFLENSMDGGAWWLSGKESACLPMQETWVQFLGWENPLQKEIVSSSSILAWDYPMDRGAWWATVHGVTKSWTLSD